MFVARHFASAGGMAESEVGFGGAESSDAKPTWPARARSWRRALQKIFGGAALAPYFKGG